MDNVNQDLGVFKFLKGDSVLQQSSSDWSTAFCSPIFKRFMPALLKDFADELNEFNIREQYCETILFREHNFDKISR